MKPEACGFPIMKKTLNGLVLAGESLIHYALITIREVRAAEAAGASREEIDRLQLLADSAYKAVVDYQCYVAKLGETTIH